MKFLLIIKILAIFLYTISPSAWGNTDCSKAKINAEEIICNNSEISVLDDKLNSSYKSLSLLLDQESKATLVKIQGICLKYRNTLKNKYDLKRSYELQLSLLDYISNNIKIIPNIETIYSLFFQEMSTLPYIEDINKIYNNIYLVKSPDSSYIGSGYYVININEKIIKKLLGGSGKIIHSSTTQNPFTLILSSSSPKKGVLRGSINVIYKDSNNLGIKRVTLENTIEDAVNGGCGRGLNIGIQESLQFIKYSTSIKKGKLILKLHMKKQDCLSDKSAKYTRDFVFVNEVFKEIN